MRRIVLPFADPRNYFGPPRVCIVDTVINMRRAAIAGTAATEPTASAGRAGTGGSLPTPSNPDQHRRPPRTARALLRRFLPADRRDDILGDLEETFSARHRRDGRWRSRRWYWGEAARLAAGFARERWTDSNERPRQVARPGGRYMWNWANDARFAARMAAKTPWMTATCIFALGAAMAVAIGGFSLLWSAYFTRLPFEDGNRIVAVRDITQPDPDDIPPHLAVFRDWQRNQRSFDVLAASYRRSWDVADGEGGLTRYPVATVTASAFDVAGVPPLLGRVLGPDDQRTGAPAVVVVGHRAWRTLLGADPDVIGRTLEIDGVEREIVGVMPEGFRFPVSEDFWVPLNTDPIAVGRVQPRWLRVFGRLAAGVSMEQAAAELDAMRSAWVEENPDAIDVRDRITTVVPYVQIDSEPGAAATIFIGGFVFIVLVLAVACASVGNLLLVRSTARTGEIAVRAALGASRARLVSQLCIEALLLTAGGAVFGVAAAHLSLGWFGQRLPFEATPFWVDFGMNPAAAAFAVVAAFVAAGLAGVVPALKATGVAMADALKDGRETTSAVRFGSISGALTVAEVTLSVALLAAAGLVAQSLLVATGIGDELPTDEVLVAHLSMADEASFAPSGEITVPEGEIEATQWTLMQEQARAAAQAIPGARVAFLTDRMPGDEHFQTRIELENETAGVPAAGARVPTAVASPQLFEAFDTALLAGRNFAAADTLESEPVAIVNGAFARRFFPDRNPIGERFRRASGGDAAPWIRIVGVTGNLRMLPGAEQTAGYYLPASQQRSNNLMLAIRVTGEPLALSTALRQAVKGIDPRIDVSGFETHAQRGVDNLLAFKMIALMFSALGGTAFFLSIAGLYAVMAFSVTQRTREIGIRLALGAAHRDVLGAILRRGLIQVSVGLVLGAALGWSLLRLMHFIPIGMASGGTALLVTAGVAMLIAGLLACVVPASRALAVHPVQALRGD
jgi:predicted permease